MWWLWLVGYDDLSWPSDVVTGILTNISGNVRPSSSSPSLPPKFANFTTVNSPLVKTCIPVARLIALNTFCQFANTSATPTHQSPTLRGGYFRFHQQDNSTLILNSPFVQLDRQRGRVVGKDFRIQLVSPRCAK
jgi:hypothetical protein